MAQQIAARGLLAGIALSVLVVTGCSPRSQTRTPVQPRDTGSTGRATQTAPRARRTGRVHNWRALEDGIPNLKRDTARALDLLSQAWNLKHKYDSLSGSARKTMGREIERLYGDAGDIYDQILDQLDTIEQREHIESGMLMRRGPKLGAFSRAWQRKSKILRRMSFH